MFQTQIDCVSLSTFSLDLAGVFCMHLSTQQWFCHSRAATICTITSLHQHRALQYMLAWYRRRSTFMILSNDFSLHFSSCERGDCTRKREALEQLWGATLLKSNILLSCSGLFSHSKWGVRKKDRGIQVSRYSLHQWGHEETQVFFTGCQFYHPAIQKIRCFFWMPYGKTNLKTVPTVPRPTPAREQITSEGSRHEWAVWKCDSRFGHSSN